MKTKHLKAAAAAVSLLIASGPALATTVQESLGASPVALDAFTFFCPVGTASARANVADIIPPFNVPARMRVCLQKCGGGGLGGTVACAEDTLPLATNGEDGPPSPPVVVLGGPGCYRATFLKTAAGAESYRGNITCHNILGVPINPAGIPVNPQQDQ